MSKIIYKYALPMSHCGKVIHRGKFNKLLTIKNQDSQGIQMWCEIDSNNEELDMTIIAVGTGNPFEAKENWNYAGTAIDDMGFVWHYYTSLKKVGT